MEGCANKTPCFDYNTLQVLLLHPMATYEACFTGSVGEKRVNFQVSKKQDHAAFHIKENSPSMHELVSQQLIYQVEE